MDISQEIKEIRLNIELQTKRLQELENKQVKKPVLNKVALRFYSNSDQDSSLFVHAEQFCNRTIDAYLDHDYNIVKDVPRFAFGFAAVYKEIANNKYYVVFTDEDEYLNADFDYTHREEDLCEYILEKLN